MKRMRKLLTLSRIETMKGMIQKKPCREKINRRQASDESTVSRSEARGTMYSAI